MSAYRIHMGNEIQANVWQSKCAIVLVGLPARGKSYIAKKIVGFLRWRGFQSEIFNVGSYRRLMAQGKVQDHGFFDNTNSSAKDEREDLAMSVLGSMLDWFAKGGNVGVFDATNTTEERRQRVVARCQQASPLLTVLFIESLCDDPVLLEENYEQKVRGSPDYRDMPVSVAMADLKKRVRNYEAVYEPITNDGLSYIKLINLRSKIICNQIQGRLPQLIATLLMCVHTAPRPLFLVRAGACDAIGDSTQYLELARQCDSRASELEDAEAAAARGEGEGGEVDGDPHPHGQEGDSTDEPSWHQVMAEKPEPEILPVALEETLAASLNQSGRVFAKRLTTIIKKRLKSEKLDTFRVSKGLGANQLPLVVFSSTHQRAQETARVLANESWAANSYSALNILHTGVVYGKTPQWIEQNMPIELGQWNADRYHYRFTGGESHADVALRLEPLVLELERQTNPVLVVSHSSTLQVLYGYFLGLAVPPSQYASLDIPRDTLIELIPSQYGWKEIRYDLKHANPSPEVILHDTEFYRRSPLQASKRLFSSSQTIESDDFDAHRLPQSKL